MDLHSLAQAHNRCKGVTQIFTILQMWDNICVPEDNLFFDIVLGDRGLHGAYADRGRYRRKKVSGAPRVHVQIRLYIERDLYMLI